MEPFLIIGIFLIAGFMIWRPHRRHRTAEEALEDAMLEAEQERHRDAAVEMVDRMHSGGSGYGPG